MRPVSALQRLMAGCLPLAPRPILARASRRYIAGEARAAALELGRRLAAAGYGQTFDVLGEDVEDRLQVEAAAAEYAALLADLARAGLDVNLSLKPTQMGLAVDEDLCAATVAALARKGRESGAFLRFEMEDSSTTDATLRVFGRLREGFPGTIGCVLQSRLRRSEADARALLAGAGPLNVRLVKGVYLEPPAIAWQKAADIDAAFLRILRALLDGGAKVAAATHDEALLDALLALLAERPQRRDRVEVQMLLGVREDLRRRTLERGVPVRVYIPYGSHWLPYVRRRLRENPRLALHGFLGLFSRRERLEPSP